MPKLTVQTVSFVKSSPKLSRWLILAYEVVAPELPANVSQALLSVTICGDARMCRMNREFRGKDKTTDVLSFPAQQGVRNKKLSWAAPGVLPLGDLVISLPQARRQAKQFGVSLEEEMIHLFIHGYLHLLGFDHELSLKEEKLMLKHEARLLKKFAEVRKKKKLK
jgi:probable rRNA maturation factor